MLLLNHFISRRTAIVACCVLLTSASQAQSHAGLASQNDHLRGTSRILQYKPDGEDFVCINGKNRYTRALYGSHSPFRLETSDRPVFAIYNNGLGGNISFYLVLPDGTQQPLDQTAYCESRYTPGKRSYHLTDPAWGEGELRIEALALSDQDGAIWRISATDMPKKARLYAKHGGITGKKLSRQGDMGVDPIDCFELPGTATDIEIREIPLTQEAFYAKCPVTPGFHDFRAMFEKAEVARKELASRIRVETPDPYLNTLGGTLAVAADGIWDGQVWLHGAIGWRMPLNGWRAAYTGDALGWHDRARTHFDAYAASQVTEVPNTIPHPAQDPTLNKARSVKEWGTPHYSNGYICRNPQNNNQMHHYDMNLCYIDELLWHFNWTGDLEYARQMWPVLKCHLAWEKLNFDPDNDGLYDAYACIWASDALYYNSGAVTYSSAYNYRANRMAARIASLIGEDAAPYQAEADKILNALNSRLWLPGKGHWAEFQDFMGHRRLHESAGVWSIYHAIDSDVADPFQAYQATRYVDTQIPHIPVMGEGLEEEGLATISTTNWLPYSWSVNNVAFAEVMHTALSYFQAGRPAAGYNLMKSSIIDGMYLGNSPGNLGQVSFYDAARGECYRDFGDPVGVASRLLIQGLFGVVPNALDGKLLLRPGFPVDWEHAALSTPDLSYRFRRTGECDRYEVEQHFVTPLELTLQLNAHRSRIESVTIDGQPAQWKRIEAASGYPVIAVVVPAAAASAIEIVWGGERLVASLPEKVCAPSQEVLYQAAESISLKELRDPQGVFVNVDLTTQKLRAKVSEQVGDHTFFLLVEQGEMEWWQPVHLTVREENRVTRPLPFSEVATADCLPVRMDRFFNASVTDIFRNEYLSPRSPYTTLQIPTQGIGEWCHPKLTAEIDDSGLRTSTQKGILTTKLGVPFRTPIKGKNIAFTSLWDNYPDSLQVPLSGHASRAYLMLAGSTNHMQCRIANGVIRVCYKDGSSETMELVNPDNWCPIEQDFFIDEFAFKVDAPRPYRIHLKTGLVSNNLAEKLQISGVYGRPIDGGAGVLLEMSLDPSKELDHLTLETLSNEVVIGLMGITLQK